ncbi:hypothetical protein ZWY2020_018018 [Hordeum vulgare]|nr:hypothetical protein ZWY2020_018018 [Hordeum vulgare]
MAPSSLSVLPAPPLTPLHPRRLRHTTAAPATTTSQPLTLAVRCARAKAASPAEADADKLVCPLTAKRHASGSTAQAPHLLSQASFLRSVLLRCLASLASRTARPLQPLPTLFRLFQPPSPPLASSPSSSLTPPPTLARPRRPPWGRARPASRTRSASSS